MNVAAVAVVILLLAIVGLLDKIAKALQSIDARLDALPKDVAVADRFAQQVAQTKPLAHRPHHPGRTSHH